MQIVFCECNIETIEQDFPILNLVIDDVSYEIPPSTYVSWQYGGQCLLDVSYQRGWDVYILGLPLFENFYTVFDQEEKRIGFARSIHSDFQDDAAISLASAHIEPAKSSFWLGFCIAFYPVVLWAIAVKLYFAKRAKDVKAASEGDYVKV